MKAPLALIILDLLMINFCKNWKKKERGAANNFDCFGFVSEEENLNQAQGREKAWI
jgi:hypothetical protein